MNTTKWVNLNPDDVPEVLAVSFSADTNSGGIKHVNVMIHTERNRVFTFRIVPSLYGLKLEQRETQARRTEENRKLADRILEKGLQLPTESGIMDKHESNGATLAGVEQTDDDS